MTPPRAFLLAAGRGTRFRPVTDAIPKPLLPFLNVPVAREHLRQLRAAGVTEAAVNLHHLGDQIEKHLIDRPSELPQLRFFRERELLGTAGALRNAREWLSEARDFLVVNSDEAITPDYEALVAAHRGSGRAATLLVVENREPDRYTPLQSEGDRITGFGRHVPAAPLGGPPLLYTGVCVLEARLLERIPPGETSLVTHLWEPMLETGREEIGWIRHSGRFADLGTPRDFLRASLEALARRGPFAGDAGAFDEKNGTLSRTPIGDFEAIGSVLGGARIGHGARIVSSIVWDGAHVEAGARLIRCVAARGEIPRDSVFRDCLLWTNGNGPAAPFPLS